MATKRKQTVASLPAAVFSKFLTRTCDAFPLRGTTTKQQERIAAVAYRFVLERSFRHGSPQEDWLKALVRTQRRRRRSVRVSATSSAPRSDPTQRRNNRTKHP
jgi:hypothetical protein